MPQKLERTGSHQLFAAVADDGGLSETQLSDINAQLQADIATYELHSDEGIASSVVHAGPLERLNAKMFLLFLHMVIIRPAKLRARLSAPYLAGSSRARSEQRISPDDMELLAAILTGQSRSPETYGHDLAYAEVKSASLMRAPFEYQYHRHGARRKLESEANVDHIFINWTNGAEDLVIRSIPGEHLGDVFAAFQDKIVQAYPEGSKGDAKQRCRVHIPAKTVETRGRKLIEVKGGRVTFVSSESLAELFPHRHW